jgi:type II secretory pathway pseudopilin PulG
MRSVSCAGCGLVGWAGAGNCKRCGQPFHVSQQPPPRAAAPPPDYNAGYNAGYNHNYGPGPGDFGAPEKRRAGYAVASLVVGILGFFTFGILLIGTIIGTSLGIAALKKANSQPAVYGGKGIAIAGIVVNILAVFMIFPIGIISAIAIPNLLASRRAANEAAAISSLRVIGNAEATYASTGAGGYGSLAQLFGARMIDENLASGTKNGYVFTVTVSGNNFEATATPVSRSHGNRSFYVSANGVIHYAPGVRPATESDPPVYSNGPQYGSQYDSRPNGATSQPGWQGAAPAY